MPRLRLWHISFLFIFTVIVAYRLFFSSHGRFTEGFQHPKGTDFEFNGEQWGSCSDGLLHVSQGGLQTLANGLDWLKPGSSV